MKTWRTFSFEINGLPVEARFPEEDIREIWQPLLRRLERLQREKGGRLVVFLAAPPATGKSTLAAFLAAGAGAGSPRGRDAVGTGSLSPLCENSQPCVAAQAFPATQQAVPSGEANEGRAGCPRGRDAVAASTSPSPGKNKACYVVAQAFPATKQAVPLGEASEGRAGCPRGRDAVAASTSPSPSKSKPFRVAAQTFPATQQAVPSGETSEGRAPRVLKTQALGLDGFHFHQDYILSHTVTQKDGRVLPMKQVKGSPETYDVAHFAEKLRALRQGNPLWPVYDRRLHDVVEEQIPVTAPIVLIEGNWLLLREGTWNGLSQMADYTIFIRADEPLLRERLLRRKMQGGLTRQEAEAFYQTGDGVNVRRVLAGSGPADLTLELQEDGSFLKLS